MPNNAAIVPSSQQPIASAQGLPTPSWVRFFNTLVAAAGPIAAVTVGASPFTYKVAARGSLRVTGGTVSSVVLTRNLTTVAFASDSVVPAANGDTVTITYSVLPTVTFIPD